MLAACAFWMMKITATARAAKPAISPVGLPMVRVCRCPRRGEPLAEGRQRAGHAVRRCWFGRDVTFFISGTGSRRAWPVSLVPSRSGRKQARRGRPGNKVSGHAGELVQCLRRNRTTSTMITMITMAPKPMNMRYSLRYMRVSWQ